MSDVILMYLGTWELMPELSSYEAGTAPLSGVYEIKESARGILELSVRWRMPGDDSERTTTFGGPSDGKAMTLPAIPGAPADAPDTFSLTHIDERTLESAAMRGGEKLMYARRTVSHDGSLLVVVQENVIAPGKRARNFQVYRRGSNDPG